MTENEKKLVAMLNTLLDQVDYTKGACGVSEMVGACLDVRVIDNARKLIIEVQS